MTTKPLISLVALLISGAGLAAHYELYIDKEDPTAGLLRLVLQEPLAIESTLIVRTLGEPTDDVVPHCEQPEQPLERKDQNWIAPDGCKAIVWPVRFRLADTAEIDLSGQNNLYHPDRWWLLTEWNDLLRPESGPVAATIRVSTGQNAIHRSVPRLNEAPLFLIYGKPDLTHDIEGIAFRFFHAFLPDDFDPDTLHDTLEQQLAYLITLTPENSIGDRISDEIDVLIMGIDESLGVVGGAAGHSAWLVNVAVGENGIKPTEQVRLLWITAHELVHLLRIDSAPLWAAESLAHYYGYKSLNDNAGAEQLFERMLEDLPDMGLLEAHHRVTQRGEAQYYGLFYTRGTAFWRAVDEQISESTGGERDLDAFLPMLREHDFGVEGELPAVFIDAIRERVEPSVLDQLLDKHL